MRPVGRRALDRIPPAPCTPGEHSPSPSASFRHRTGEGSSCIIHRSSFIVSPPQHPPGNYQPATSNYFKFGIQHSAFSIQKASLPPRLLRLCLRVLSLSAVASLLPESQKPTNPQRIPPPTPKPSSSSSRARSTTTRNQLEQRINQVRGLGAANVILDINTCGGIVTDGLEISRFLKRQTDLHIVAYVKDKAISAGAVIAMACNEIVVSNSASLGNCTPSSSAPTASRPCPRQTRQSRKPRPPRLRRKRSRDQLTIPSSRPRWWM